jgi:hypothetical protein
MMSSSNLFLKFLIVLSSFILRRYLYIIYYIASQVGWFVNDKRKIRINKIEMNFGGETYRKAITWSK